jgi:hypothetical protein
MFIPDPGVKTALDPRSRILNTGHCWKKNLLINSQSVPALPDNILNMDLQRESKSKGFLAMKMFLGGV